MGGFGDVLVGFFIGALCGIIPLAFGLLTKHKILSIAAIIVTALSGAGFDLLEKTPFTAMGVAIIFIVIIFAKNKNKHDHHEEDHDIYMHDE